MVAARMRALIRACNAKDRAFSMTPGDIFAYAEYNADAAIRYFLRFSFFFDCFRFSPADASRLFSLYAAMLSLLPPLLFS